MLTREHLEEIERQNLAPYACKSGDSEGRVHREEEHPFRTRFQRDRDRVIHSRAFRRLEYKTQVFVNHEGDYYRTRLTHSLEVAQIARTISRSLGLNEDLAETVALAHDLGHTPFGHSGEHVMNRLMKEHGGFEHNRQSFRVVTFLEYRYPEFSGLNLTYEVLEGITKHKTEYDLPDGSLFERKGYPSLEAQLCNFADEIAYNNHDVDDGLKSGMIDLSSLKDLKLWETHFQKTKKKYPAVSQRIQISQTVRTLINTVVTDLVNQTMGNIKKLNIKSIEDVRQKGKNCVDLSPEIKKLHQELKQYLMANLYKHYRVVRMAEKAERIMIELFKAYVKNPRVIPPSFLRRYDSDKSPNERIVCDYISGMTDRFALDEYKKLFDPHEKV